MFVFHFVYVWFKTCHLTHLRLHPLAVVTHLVTFIIKNKGIPSFTSYFSFFFFFFLSFLSPSSVLHLVIELCISFWWFAQQLAATMASFIVATVVARSDVSCQRLDHEVRLNDIAVNSSWLGMGFCGGNGGWWRFVTVFLQVRSLSGL